MGKRFIKITSVLFLFVLHQVGLLAQTEVGTVNTNCAFTVTYTIHHPTCPEEADGSINLEVNDAIGTACIYWIDNGNGSDSIVSALGAGAYKARIGDEALCFDTLTFNLADPSPILFDVMAEKSCPGESNGLVTVAPTSGSADAYSIDGGNTQDSPIFSDLSPGFHTVRAIDPSGCYYEETIEITEIETPIVTFAQEETSCAGTTNAAFIVIIETVSNSEDYEFSIDGTNYQPDSTFEDLATGTYEVYIKNENQCVFTESIDVLETVEPEITIEKSDLSCPDVLDASFIVIIETVSNSEDYEYSIDGTNYQPDSTFEDLAAGTYEVFIKNTNQCVFTRTVAFEAPIAPEITIEKNDATCMDALDASFIVIIETVSNSEDYEFSIDGTNYQPDSIFEDLTVGTYEVFVKNENQCVFTRTVEIETPQEPLITIDQDDVTCPDGNDASFIVIIETVSNSENYEYSLDGTNYQASPTFENLESDFYQVFIKNSAACVFEETVFIEAPSPAFIDFDVNEVTCPGEADASFIVIIETVSNSEDYEYSIDGTNYYPDSVFTDLSSGVYTVYARNESGCVQNKLLEIATPEIPTLDFEIDEVTCPEGNDASFIVIIETVSNSENYEYTIDGGTYQPDSIFTDLEAGVYEVYARNTAGCVFTKLVEVEEPEMPEIDFEINHTTCWDGDDASFIVIIETVSNTEDYEFSLNGNEYQPDSIFTNLSAGVHDISIRNEWSCIFTETIEIIEPEVPAIDFNIDPVTCSGGNDASFIVIIETVSNSENYEYSIDGLDYQDDSTFVDFEAGIFDVYVRNAAGCVTTQSIVIEEPLIPSINFDINEVTCSGGTDASLIVIIETVSNSENYEYSIDGVNYQPDSAFIDLSAGVYTAHIRNDDNCIYTQMFEITEPEEMELNLTSGNVTCPGADDGVITAWATGPIGGFEYALDGINFQNSNVFENLAGGIYDVTIRNANGCLMLETALITAPQVPQYEVNIDNVSCNGGNNGRITVNMFSGIEPFNYALNSNGSFQSSNIFDGLSEGEYTLYMRDANGCVFSSTANLAEPLPINAQTNLENETCDYDNGWIAIAVEGGTSPYTYEWGTEETSPAISNLSEGTYHLSITDSRNCLLTETIVIENEPAPSIEAQIQNLNCFDDENGAIDLDVISESAPFNFIWSNGTQSEDLNNLGAGTYNVTVTDRNNCHAAAHFVLEEQEAIELNGVLQINELTATVDLSVQGGQAPYDYKWSNGDYTEDLEDIPFGFYTVTVTDANGCEMAEDFRALDPDLPVDGSINVYPTLTSNEVNVDIHLPEEKEVNIYLVDELGRIIQVLDPSMIEQQVFTLDLERLAAAVYFLRIEIGEDFVVKKVVKVME